MNNFETFSHTHRSFDIKIKISDTIIKDLYNIITTENLEILAPCFITKEEHIQFIYDHSDIPLEDKTIKFINDVNRKNSQVFAPLLIILPIKSPINNKILFNIGRLYSKLGLYASEKGYQTGFCICYNGIAIRPFIIDNYGYSNNFEINSIPFLSIGKQISNVPYNYQIKDINRVVQSQSRISSDYYITTKV
jgi:hypothetical protein